MNLLHVFEQGDTVLMSTFCLLTIMSIVSWYIIFWKAWSIRKESARLSSFSSKYITSPNWPKTANITNAKGCVVTLLDEGKRVLPLLNNATEEERKEILSVHISQSLDSVRLWLDKGLTILASIGTSSPFIGLFGTVWGVYRALTEIATQGNASLNVVAGPMGEALVMTALGLFAAIPAVLSYNAFVRSNRVLIQKLRHISEHLSLYLYEDHNSSDSRKSLKIA